EPRAAASIRKPLLSSKQQIPLETSWFLTLSSQTTCQSLGGHLASVHNEDEQMLIRQLAGTNTRTWIGGTLGRVWMWTDGSRFEYQAWYTVEPNNTGGNENCVEIINGGIYQGSYNFSRSNSKVISGICQNNYYWYLQALVIRLEHEASKSETCVLYSFTTHRHTIWGFH
ncbi:ladderlectin-like, partial [Archocentrus centrarchus]|uniref:ladderlectin-like n=1 Tax=Archocentrus centrarchus TaxID=63155 RepID=UPI0011E9BBB5